MKINVQSIFTKIVSWAVVTVVISLIGFVVTGAAVTANLTSGSALRILVCGAAVTAAAVWLLSRLPHGRPSLKTRAVWWWRDIHPTVWCSHPRRR